MLPTPDGQATPPAFDTNAAAYAMRRLGQAKQLGYLQGSLPTDMSQAASAWRQFSSSPAMNQIKLDATAAGHPDPHTYLEASASAGRPLANTTRTLGAYTAPTQQVNQQMQAMGRANVPLPVINQQINQGAQRYAAQRMGQMSRAFGDDPEFQKLIDPNSNDPIKAWGTSSAFLTQRAKAAGYADPRAYLADLLKRG